MRVVRQNNISVKGKSKLVGKSDAAASEFGHSSVIVKEQRMSCQVRAKVIKIADTVAHSSRVNGAKSEPSFTAHEWK